MPSLSAPGMKDNSIISNLEALILKFPIRSEHVEQDPSCAATWNTTPTLHVFYTEKQRNRLMPSYIDTFSFPHFLRAMAFQEAQGQI